jgi:16S rRNA (guanine527-N7)-methyltransferase
VISDRAETIAHDCENHREQYDLVVARAVGRLVVLAELAVPLVRVGGHVAAIKGAKAVKEIEEAAEAVRLLHSEDVETTRTPTGTIVLIEKLRRTAKLYPRRPGEPKRAPLGVSRDR